MTASQDSKPELEATVELPESQSYQDFGMCRDIDAFDPEKTLVRENWESTAIRRVAPHIAAVQSSVADDAISDGRFGWESEGLRRLALELQRAAK